MRFARRGHKSGFAVYRMRGGDVFYHGGHFYIVTSTRRRSIGARRLHWKGVCLCP